MNLKERNIRNVTLFKLPIEQWKPRPISLAYLDGDHTQVGTTNQIIMASRCNPLHIAIHDVEESGDGLIIKETAISILGAYDERSERLAVWSGRQIPRMDIQQG